jgi:hypothetical protein
MHWGRGEKCKPASALLWFFNLIQGTKMRKGSCLAKCMSIYSLPWAAVCKSCEQTCAKKLAKPFTENRQQGPQNATVYTRGWEVWVGGWDGEGGRLQSWRARKIETHGQRNFEDANF